MGPPPGRPRLVILLLSFPMHIWILRRQSSLSLHLFSPKRTINYRETALYPIKYTMKKLLNIFKNLAFLGFGVFLFWLVYRHEDFGKMAKQMAGIHIGYILSAFIVGVMS